MFLLSILLAQEGCLDDTFGQFGLGVPKIDTKVERQFVIIKVAALISSHYKFVQQSMLAFWWCWCKSLQRRDLQWMPRPQGREIVV
jgi:hypothetical protein